MVKAIHLGKDYRDSFVLDESPEFLFNLDRFNVFIGSNNAGKSRLLRALTLTGSDTIFFDHVIDLDKCEEIKSRLTQIYNHSINRYRNRGVDIERFLEILNQFGRNRPEDFLNNLKAINDLESLDESWFKVVPNAGLLANMKQDLTQFRQSSINEFKRAMEVVPNTLYIPVLRGLRPIQSVKENREIRFLNTDSFSLRTNFDYFKNKKAIKPNIFSGLTIYDDVRKLLLGTEEERLEIQNFELFLSDYVFKTKVTLIPKHDEDVLHIKIGNQNQYEIYNLGDGLQAIISILFPIFVRRHLEHLVFIEEPEIHLHISWQILLIRALKSRDFEKHQFFLSTHSPVFINDTVAKVFHVSKNSENTLVKSCFGEKDKVEIVNELGLKPSHLFQTNFILWVEGPSDKILFNHWISKLDNTLIEDYHFSIMFINGENYRSFLKGEESFELDFISSLNQNFGIVLDSDRTDSNAEFNPKKLEIQNLFEKENNFCWITNFKEIENYIPAEAYQTALMDVHKVDLPISDNGFTSRTRLVDQNSEVNYKSTIQLPTEVFSTVQANADGTTKGVNARTLRSAIENAIRATGHKRFKTKKVLMAKKLVELDVEINNEELYHKMSELLDKIYKANNMKITPN